ncbi:MAG: PASTA domain-containing protein [Alicyclobacillaceae bacterium]|nr:PASTA domain-containing protein [Alicyclobacillaceae bacterium]
MLSVDPRWLWIDESGHLWFYGLGVEETPLPRQLARLAAQLATGQTDPPLDWDVLERHFLPNEDVPGLWIRAFGHWWLRAISKDPEMQFKDAESCVRALREVAGEARPFPLTEPQLPEAVSESRAKAFQPEPPAIAEVSSAESHVGERPDGRLSRMRPNLRRRLGEIFRRFQWSKASMWVLVAILAVFGGASLGYAVFMRGSNEVTMPFVVGKPYNEAVSELVKAGLDPSKVVKEPQPSTQPPGTVIAQDPFGGKVIKGDRLVHLQVAVAPSSPPPGTAGGSESSAGAPSQRPRSNPGLQSGDKTVPDLTGLTLQEAQNQLLSLGIHYRYEIVASDRPKDTVIEQNPSPGTRVGNDDEVVFRVSRGS